MAERTVAPAMHAPCRTTGLAVLRLLMLMLVATSGSGGLQLPVASAASSSSARHLQQSLRLLSTASGSSSVSVSPPSTAGLMLSGVPVCPCTALLSHRLLLVGHFVSDASNTFVSQLRSGCSEAGKLFGSHTESFFLSREALASRGGDAGAAMVDLLESQYARFEAEGAFPSALLTSIPGLDVPGFQRAVARWRSRGVRLLTYQGSAEAAHVLGAEYHLSSDEVSAGAQAGTRFAQAGVRQAVCFVRDRFSTSGQRCEAFVARFLATCTGVCHAEVLALHAFSDDAAQVQLNGVLGNHTISGVLVGDQAGARVLLPLLAQHRQVGRRIGAFDVLGNQSYHLLDTNDLFFVVDGGVWLQGFLPTLLGSYMLHSSQRLFAPPGQAAVLRTGPVFVAARSSSMRRRPQVPQLHLDYVVHNQRTVFWDTFERGARLAARVLQIQFRNCMRLGEPAAVPAEACDFTSAQPQSLRYFAPSVLNDVGSMANFLSRANQQGTHGVVTTLSSPAVLQEPVRGLVSEGVPVFSTNSGSEAYQALGTLGHVGQHDYAAGYEAGVHAVKSGAVRGLCMQSHRSNSALFARCKGFELGFLTTLNVTRSPWMPSSPDEYAAVAFTIAAEIDFDERAATALVRQTLRDRPDVNWLLVTGGNLMRQILPLLQETGRWNRSADGSTASSAPPFPFDPASPPRLYLSTFDCAAVQVVPMFAESSLAFCIEQQEIMQAWLPPVLVAMRALTGHMLEPGAQHFFSTGPRIVTAENVGQYVCAGRELCDWSPTAPPDAIRPVPRTTTRSVGAADVGEDDDDGFGGCRVPAYARDGWCDTVNNVAECGYDGGDCCASTCRGATVTQADGSLHSATLSPADNAAALFQCGTDTYSTGWNRYTCVDPAAAENSAAASSFRTVGGLDERGVIALIVTVGVLALLLCATAIFVLVKWRQNVRTRKAERKRRQHLQAQARAQNQFLAHMSHEVRTPIHGVLASANLLALTEQSLEQRECTATIEKSAEHLLGVVNDILTFSSLDAGKLVLTRRWVRLRKLLEDSIDMACAGGMGDTDTEVVECTQFHPALFQSHTPQSAVGSTDHAKAPLPNASGSAPSAAFPDWPDSLIYVDEQRVRQILINLSANALKFSSSPGPVEVSVYVCGMAELLARGLVLDASEQLSHNLSGRDSSTATTDAFQLERDVRLTELEEAHVRTHLPPPLYVTGPRITLDGVDVSPPCYPPLYSGSAMDSSDGLFVLFGVRDHGVGIGHADRSRLFQPFSQLDHSSTRRFQGTGLGLAISRKLVQAMQGHLWLVSEQGKGSMFYCALPMLAGSSNGTSSTGRSPGGGQAAVTDSSVAPTASTSLQRQPVDQTQSRPSVSTSRGSCGPHFVAPPRLSHVVLVAVSCPAQAASLRYTLSHLFTTVRIVSTAEDLLQQVRTAQPRDQRPKSRTEKTIGGAPNGVAQRSPLLSPPASELSAPGSVGHAIAAIVLDCTFGLDSAAAADPTLYLTPMLACRIRAWSSSHRRLPVPLLLLAPAGVSKASAASFQQALHLCSESKEASPSHTPSSQPSRSQSETRQVRFHESAEAEQPLLPTSQSQQPLPTCTPLDEAAAGELSRQLAPALWLAKPLHHSRLLQALRQCVLHPSRLSRAMPISSAPVPQRVPSSLPFERTHGPSLAMRPAAAASAVLSPPSTAHTPPLSVVRLHTLPDHSTGSAVALPIALTEVRPLLNTAATGDSSAALDGAAAASASASSQGDSSSAAVSPLLPPSAVSSAAVSPPAVSGAAPLRILVAEDHPVNIKLMRRMLSKLTYPHEIVEDGQAACRMAAQAQEQGRPFGLILMDVQMPVMDGVQATRWLRSWSATQLQLQPRSAPAFRAPVIVGLTAHALADEQQRCLDAGMARVKSKPLTFQQLKEELHEWDTRIRGGESHS